MISHSEISTYLECQKKWELEYKKGIRIDNIHFQFGEMGHKVLETRQIPNEELYPELKESFGINSWQNYFQSIFDELDDYFKDYELLHKEYKVEFGDLKGIIDCVWRNKTTNRILITDYKFSNSIKTYEDLYLDEQMYIYATCYALKNRLNLNDFDIGYINIPKKELDSPRVLKNGELSKDKAQFVTPQKYIQTIKEHNLNIVDYEDFLSEIAGKRLVSIYVAPLNTEMCERIIHNIDNVIKDMNKGYVLEKCSYVCKNCEYVDYCKHNKKENKNEINCEN